MPIQSPIYILGTELDLGVFGWLPTVWKYESGVATKVHVDNVNFNGGTWGAYATGFAFAESDLVLVSSGPTAPGGFDRAIAYAVGGVWTNLVAPVACTRVEGIFGTGPSDIYIVGNYNAGAYIALGIWRWDGATWTQLVVPIAAKSGGARSAIYHFEVGKFYVFTELGIPPLGSITQARVLLVEGSTVTDLGGPVGVSGGPPGIAAFAWKMLSPTESIHLSISSGPSTFYVVKWDGAIWTPSAGIPAIFTGPANFLEGDSPDALYGCNAASVFKVDYSANSIAPVYTPAASVLIEQVRRDPISGDFAAIRNDGFAFYLDSSPDGAAWGGVAISGIAPGIIDLKGLIFEEAPAPVVSLVIGEDGGYELSVTGTFPAGAALEVFLGPAGDETDTPCYGGPGRGYNPVSFDGASLTVISPPIAPGAGYSLSWRQVGGGAPAVLGDVTVLERNWTTKEFLMRGNFPPWTGAGVRMLDREPLREP